LLDEKFYDEQIERLSNLPRFPQVPATKQEYRRVLRRISESDSTFIRRLISDVVDTNEKCPTPAELLRRAGDMRQRNPSPMGNPECDRCGGTGFIHSTRRVNIKGVAPYDAEVSEPCSCGVVK